MEPDNRPAKTFPSERMRRWFYYYVDPENPTTYMNASRSAEAAGYQCSSNANFSRIGHKIKKRLEPMINEWLEQEGLSDLTLKAKLASLISAKETKIVSIKGEPIELTEGVRLLVGSVQSKIVSNKDDFREYNEQHSIIAIDVENIEVQRKALETALKIKGILKDEVSVSGLDGIAERIIEARNRIKGDE